MKMSGFLAGLLLAAAIVRRRSTSLIARVLNLPPPRFRVGVRAGLEVAASDEITLATDHYYPVASGQFPTVLIRTPYGRRLPPAFYAQRFAERGYHVVVQDVRGRFGSDGEFEPFIHEGEDGMATLSWLRSQPWFDGRLGTWGLSYLGYTQWALATAAPDAVGALLPALSTSEGALTGFTGGAPWLELPLRWMIILDALNNLPGGSGQLAPWRTFWRMLGPVQNRLLAQAARHRPLAEVDELLIGHPISHFRETVNQELPQTLLQTDLSGQIADVQGAVHLLAGWHDFMLDGLLRDYATLRAAGKRPFLTLGPWTHVERRVAASALREGLAWFDATLKGKHEKLRQDSVRVFVMGAGEWRSLSDWPPPARAVDYYLSAAGGLTKDRPTADSRPDRYVYDPADPTPAVGGALFGNGAGQRENRSLEARADVLTYTSAPLAADLEIMGPVQATLFVASSCEATDFFVRLCDVRRDGASLNVCDGVVRLTPGSGAASGDGARCIEVTLWDTAYRFAEGHRLRLQVSSGAHPRLARNPGTGERFATGAVMALAVQTVYHDEARPSSVCLPVVS
jgi:putative CocE/NonD family hydrolase